MKIFKYEIPIEDEFTLKLPHSSQILSFQCQKGKPYIWVLHPENKPLVDHHFSLIGTGHHIKPCECNFIGTVQLLGGDLVYHLFQRL